MNISEEGYKKFLSFKTNYKYSINEIKKIIDNIPLEFFDIPVYNSKYNVKTSFPLIDEILDGIFRYIVVNKDFDSFKYLSNNVGSAYSSLLKYKVIYNFSGEINYFKNFFIQDNIIMEPVIPKNNDKDEPKFIKQLEPNKSYLVEKIQYDNKYLDFLIIHMSNNPEVFGFKVYNENEEIFSSLKNTYEILIERLNISFDINLNENDIYFGDIFDYCKLSDPHYEFILKKFKEFKKFNE